MLAVTLDDTHRIAVARLAAGQPLLVTAPPCTLEITGKADQPWVLIRFDDFGIRPTFVRNGRSLAPHFAGTGYLFRAVDVAAEKIEASDGYRVARIVFEPTGTKRKTVWRATGDYELFSDDPAARLPFWPPQVGDVWLGNLDGTSPTAWVCHKPDRLTGVHDWDAEEAYGKFGPLRLVWRGGAIVTAHHASQLAAKAGD